MKNKTLTIACIMILGLNAFAQETHQKKQQPKSIFTIEVDPLPYILEGYGGHIGWAPKKSEHFAFGVGFVANPKLPDAYLNLSSKNKNMGWHGKVNQGIGLWVHYYLNERNQKWFVGLQLFTQEIELSNDNFPGETNQTNVGMAVLQAGYLWRPFKKNGLFLRPWAGLAYQGVLDKQSMSIGDKEFYLSPVIPFAAIHIGYIFNLNK